MTRTEFYNKYMGTAKRVSQLSGGQIPYQTILAAMAWETDFGANRGAQSLNNLAGIKFSPAAAKLGAVQDGMYAKYPTLDAFAQDFARVLRLGYYKDIHAAGSTPDPADDFVAWNKSPYAEHDYNVVEMVKRVGEINKLGGGSAASGSTGNFDTKYFNTKAGQLNDGDKVKFAALGLAVIALAAIMD